MRLSYVLPALFLAAACRSEAPPTDTSPVDADGDGAFADVDCNDADAAVFPGAIERCNGIDDNCVGGVDEEDGDGTFTWYADADGDGHGDGGTTASGCVAPSGYVADNTDCDDIDSAFHPGASESDCTDPHDYNCDGSVGFADADADGSPACQDCDDTVAGVNPSAAELCDGVDNDCDGTADEEATDRSTWYVDADADGHGGSVTQLACEQPVGFESASDDCDDLDAASYPGAPETCDGADNDCDGVIPADELDADVDGHSVCEGDCDDASAAVYPGATELCDGLDTDCNGAVDDQAANPTTWYGDGDGDGHAGPALTRTACNAPEGFSATWDDCDDANASVAPGADELCDGLDNNCDGVLPTDEADADHDGLATCAGDCDDAQPSVRPGSPERCDELDNDCDGSVDNDALDALLWYADVDADGVGDPSVTERACALPAGKVANAGDCDDGVGTVHPGAVETCDGVDQNCNGVVDDNPADPTTWHPDADADGHGGGGATVDACVAPTGYLASADDCDDLDPAVSPSTVEQVYNGVDDDCDPSTLDDDLDGDGYVLADDCDDTDANLHPDPANPGAPCALGARCADIQGGPSDTGSGVYPIDPDGLGGVPAFPAYCDMSTSGGGWTLCLNSRYTAAAAPLFTDTYAPVREADPQGYYDWCPQDAGDYLFGLADAQTDGSWLLHTAVFEMTGAVPWDTTGEWNTVGVKAPFSQVTWVERDPAISPTFPTGDMSLSFWEYINPSSRGLRGFKRGQMYFHRDTYNIFIIGAGCNYGSCTTPPSWDSTVSPAGWGWRLPATAGWANYSSGWTTGPYQGDRMQVYYR